MCDIFVIFAIKYGFLSHVTTNYCNYLHSLCNIQTNFFSWILSFAIFVTTLLIILQWLLNQEVLECTMRTSSYQYHLCMAKKRMKMARITIKIKACWGNSCVDSLECISRTKSNYAAATCVYFLFYHIYFSCFCFWWCLLYANNNIKQFLTQVMLTRIFCLLKLRTALREFITNVRQ